MTNSDSFSHKVVINAPANLIYRAFTSGSALREWLCDIATVNLDTDGWFFVAWNRGYFASGQYKKLIPNKAISLSWIGSNDPQWTEVEVKISPVEEDSGFLVELCHNKIGGGDEWAQPRTEIEKGWAQGMKNLKTTLEDGRDLRIMKRPLIGIYPEDLDRLPAETREQLNLPVESGVLVTNVLLGYGAEMAGMQPNDVIISIEGQQVGNIKTLGLVINEFEPGDKVAVEVYRGSEKLVLQIDTMVQKIDPIPESPEELAKEIEAKNSKMIEDLESVFENVTDSEASFSPGAEEWSAKEVLVHLILSERDTHKWINDLVAGQDRFYDQYPGDRFFRIRATLTTYPGIDDLMTELRRSLKETVASVAFLDPGFTHRKVSFSRLAMALFSTPKHVDEHLQQIKDNVQAARAAAKN